MKISLWDSKTLLVLLAIGQGAALVYASIALDGHADPALLTLVAIVRGVLVGIGASFAAAYSSFQLPRVKKVMAQKIGWWALGGLVVFSAFVVGASGAETPQGPLRWFVSGAYAVLTECAVIAVAMASGKLFADAPAEPSLTAAEPKPKKKRAADLPVITEPAPVVVPVGHWEVARPCPHCAASGAPLIADVNLFTNKAKFSGHTGKCKNNPARKFAEAATKERSDG